MPPSTHSSVRGPSEVPRSFGCHPGADQPPSAARGGKAQRDHTTSTSTAPTGEPGHPSRSRHRRRVAALAGGSALLAGIGGGAYALVAGASALGSAATTLDAASQPSSPSSAGGTLPVAGATLPLASAGRPWGPRAVVVGLLTNVGTGSLTVETPSGATVQVKVDSSTSYRQGTTSLAFGRLASGEDVAVVPTSDTAGGSSPTAATVRVVGPVIAGQVVSMSGTTIVVSGAQGLHRTIVASSSTGVTTASGTSGTLGSVTVGTRIAALGTIAADHADLVATSIYVLPAPSPGAERGPGSHGPLGPDGFGSFGSFGGFGGFGSFGGFGGSGGFGGIGLRGERATLR